MSNIIKDNYFPEVYTLTHKEVHLINLKMPRGYQCVLTNKMIPKKLKNYRTKKNKHKNKLLKAKNLNKFYSNFLFKTIEEKENFIQRLRYLPLPQLRGIKYLLKNNEALEKKSGFFELNVDKLNNNDLEKLYKYFKSCTKSSKDIIPTKYQIEFKGLSSNTIKNKE